MKKFTLIELLVVVAIIGILVSILLPSLTKARMVAKIAVCKSNMSQVGKGFTLFARNNDGKFPVSTWNALWFGTHVYTYNNKKYNVGGTGDYIASDESGEVYYCATRSNSPQWSGNNILPLKNDTLRWGNSGSHWRGDYVYRYYLGMTKREPHLTKDNGGLAVAADFWYRGFGGYFHGGVKKGVSSLYLDGSVASRIPGNVTVGDGQHTVLENMWLDVFDRE